MAGEARWIFSSNQLQNTPSQRCGIDNGKELNYRQQLANIIQDMGQRLQVTQLCINTAIVYMHRFYMMHSFAAFNRNSMASACLFLAAKVEEQPRKLEHVIKVAHMIINTKAGTLDTKSESYLKQAQELVINENILLQTLGFDITVDHPHTHVVKTSQLVKASKDLAQTSYFLATNSLHLTTMCLQYRPTVVAAVCIHLACKWSNWEIPRSSEGKEWFLYIDSKVSSEILESLSQEFLNILERCPSKLKKKIMAWKLALQTGRGTQAPDDAMAGKKFEPSASMSSAAAAAAAGSTSMGAKVKPEMSSQQKMHPPLHGPRPDSKSSGMASEGGMRRVKTEPSLTSTSLTPKEYLERRERMRQQQQEQQKSRHHTHGGHPSHPDPMAKLQHQQQQQHPHSRHHERPPDMHRSHRPPSSSKDPAHSTAVPNRDPSRTRPDLPPARPDFPPGHAGHTEGKKSREHHRSGDHRGHGEQLAQRHQGDSRARISHSQPTRERERSPLLSTLSQDLGGILDPIPNIKFDPLPPPEMLMAELTKPVTGEPEKPAADVRLPPRQTQASLSRATSSEALNPLPPPSTSKELGRHKHPVPEMAATRLDIPPPPPPALVPPPPALVPPPPPPPEVVKPEVPQSGSGDTKLKISLGQLKERYQASSKHSDKASPRKSKRDRSRDPPPTPDSGGDKKDLKLKISLGSSPGVASVKREEASRSSPSEVKVKRDKSLRVPDSSEHGRSPVVGGEASARREYNVSNEGNPLKLKLKLGPSTSSPGPSRKHSSSHSSKNGSHSQNRKRPYSPQTSTSQLPAKMSRNDSLSDMGLANGNTSGSPNVATPSTENIEDVRRQLQQLIDLQSAQLHAKISDDPDAPP